MKPEEGEREPLDRAEAARRGRKFLQAMREGGREAFGRAFDEELPPEPEAPGPAGGGAGDGPGDSV